jgi:hypothetical protein
MSSNSSPSTTESPAKEKHPLDEATWRYNNSLQRIRMLNSTLSKKSLNRVYNATMGFPLAESTPKFKDKQENELFMLTLTALAAKDQILVFLYENQDALKEGMISSERNEEHVGQVGTEESKETSGVS